MEPQFFLGLPLLNLDPPHLPCWFIALTLFTKLSSPSIAAQFYKIFL